MHVNVMFPDSKYKELCMKNHGLTWKRNVSVSAAVLLLVFCFTLTGCSLFRSNAVGDKKTEKTLWHSREQNVRIIPQDAVKGAAVAANDHPIMLAPDQIRSALKSLEVKPGAKDDSVPVFTEPELDTLAGKLSEGLSQASPSEDVSFVVIGQRKAIYGLAKQRKVTTGRVFYREGKLNVIFGRMIEDIREYVDLRAFPLTPGSRVSSVTREWKLEETPDMQYHGEDGMYRTDWAVLDLASIAAHGALGTRPAKAPGAPRAEGAVPRSEVGSRDDRQEHVPVDQTTYIPQTGKAAKSIEERLTILNDLKNKKLITEDEYQAKRADILKDL